ncbi:MAG TPA: ABC transporter substrate-binding protein, partial [Candidatus Dormibacteraeota bacterium]|nr:ABC transporter substrate-binding protein [Candidatus Dormibacteraeota bacterium]
MRLTMIVAPILVVGVIASPALAQDLPSPVKIGVLTDLSGGYVDALGDGAVVAARLAANDSGLVLGQHVQIIAADYDRSPEVGAAIARDWYDNQGVDMVTDGGSSPVALAVEAVSRERHKLVLFSGPATDEITGLICSPYAARWTYSSYALARAAASVVLEQGGSTWYFIGTDTALSRELTRDATAFIEHRGGAVVGVEYAPRGTADFSSFLSEAQRSKAAIIGLTTRAGDVIRLIRQSAAFGIAEGGQRFVPLLMFITDVHRLGLETAQGLRYPSAFYWDTDEATRRFAHRFFARVHSMPTMVQAGVYSATRHYLKAVK